MTKVGAIIAREMEKSEEKGLQKGLQRGIQQGMQQGIEQGRINAVRDMIDFGLPKDQILKRYTESEYEQAKQALLTNV